MAPTLSDRGAVAIPRTPYIVTISTSVEKPTQRVRDRSRLGASKAVGKGEFDGELARIPPPEQAWPGEKPLFPTAGPMWYCREPRRAALKIHPHRCSSYMVEELIQVQEGPEKQCSMASKFWRRTLTHLESTPHPTLLATSEIPKELS
ncbi:hypothetical protein An16g00790 [Aspergillus niger]|uniref:Uncharacterized protein n=2 Tax=Aspergillus niger TaxID=5061 RepID=A2R6Q0_ASPNC|nr:hypothetical protein An16g00790 [Aspergillus niger]CAK46765.1 hypothetical protein An16g00790 [Aspergillus niger]